MQTNFAAFIVLMDFLHYVALALKSGLTLYFLMTLELVEAV